MLGCREVISPFQRNCRTRIFHVMECNTERPQIVLIQTSKSSSVEFSESLPVFLLQHCTCARKDCPFCSSACTPLSLYKQMVVSIQSIHVKWVALMKKTRSHWFILATEGGRGIATKFHFSSAWGSGTGNGSIKGTSTRQISSREHHILIS